MPAGVWSLRVVGAWGALALLGALGGCRYVSQSQNVQGVRFFQQGNYPAALQQFNQAIAQDPRNADGYYNLAAVYHNQARQSRRREDYDQAEVLYNQCLDNQSNHVDCHRALAVLLAEQGRTDEAFRLLERWALREPLLPAAKVELARLSQEFGRRDAARQQLQEALALQPFEPRALAALGRLYEEDGDTSRALANYQRSLQANGLQPDLAQRVAQLQRSAAPALTPVTTPGLAPVTVPGTRTVVSPTTTGRY